MGAGSEFILGLDLGQAQDFTAMAVIERIPTTEQKTVDHGEYSVISDQPGPWLLHVRHLERFQLGTPYPAIIERVKALMSRPELINAVLVVDATGVGRPVVDSFRNDGLYPLAVTITGGDASTHEDYYNWRVPKRDLVGGLQVTLQQGRLKFAEGLPDVQTLIQELLAFQVKITTSANDTYGAWREGAHDDLVLALAMAVWQAEKMSTSWLLS